MKSIHTPKILYLITKSNFGGAQRYVFDLATSLDAAEFGVAVAFGGTGTYGAETGGLHTALTQAGVRTLTLHHITRDIFILKEFQALYEIYKLLRSERPDILHLNSSKAGVLGVLAGRLAGVRAIVFTAHGWPFTESHRPLWWRAVAWLGSWLTVQLSHQVITISEFHRAKTPRALGARTMTIYNGIRAGAPLSQARAREELLPDLGRAPLIGTVAELTANKGIDIALRACALLSARDISYEFVVIGDGDDRKQLEKLTHKLGIEESVHFTGYRNQAAELMPAFDIFLLTSRKEGLPYVILEAGAAALPVIATEVGGIPEVIHHGESGEIVPPESPERLAATLQKMLCYPQLCESYGSTLKRSITTQFTIDRMVEETTAVYRALQP